MDGLRNTNHVRRLCIAALGLCCCLLSGCGAVATALYVMNGTNIDAEFDELRGKKVAVVCRPTISLEFSNTSVARDLARRIGTQLATNVWRVKVVDPREVERWMDENTWEDFVEVGEGVEAEVLIAVDLEGFSLYGGQTVYQGKANYSLTVYDVETKKTLFERTPPQSLYPPHSGVPTSDMQEPEFRRQFVTRLGEEIARYFYDHDPKIDFGTNGGLPPDIQSGL